MHKAMYGEIIADMVGSIYERSPSYGTDSAMGVSFDGEMEIGER